MNIIVQKFGGTSLVDEKRRKAACKKILNKYNENYKIVVVVSAIGRVGDPYATDSLLRLVDERKLDNREIDLLLSCGEIISAVVLANMLKVKGIDSKVLTGYQAGIITDTNFGDADIVNVKPGKIVDTLREKQIVIVAGFQGATPNGEITTLGRGGSDISAIALGKALEPDCIEIYTDVDGVMTADPKIVSDARVLKTMCYSEVYQLAEGGAKVIHPKAIDMARRYNIPVKIKNTFSDHFGTTIRKMDNSCKNKEENPYENAITAITYKKDCVQICIETNKGDYAENLMKKLTENDINIDLINFLVDRKIFTVDKNDLEKIIKILNEEHYIYNIIKDCCKISAIGYKMQGVPGVMWKIVNTLASEGVEILQSSDSYNTIWFLIKEKDLERTIKSLHKSFNLGNL